MKKFLILAFVVVAVGAVWYLNHRSSAPIINSQPAGNTAAGHVDLSNASFIDTDGSKVKIDDVLTLTDKIAYGDINKDGKEDAAVILARQGGASDFTTLSVAVYVSGALGYKGTNMIDIGTQVIPRSISISGTTVSVTYLDRGPSDPLSVDPTILTTKQYTYSPLDNSLSER